jgi:hypothetical protein
MENAGARDRWRDDNASSIESAFLGVSQKLLLPRIVATEPRFEIAEADAESQR